MIACAEGCEPCKVHYCPNPPAVPCDRCPNRTCPPPRRRCHAAERRRPEGAALRGLQLRPLTCKVGREQGGGAIAAGATTRGQVQRRASGRAGTGWAARRAPICIVRCRSPPPTRCRHNCAPLRCRHDHCAANGCYLPPVARSTAAGGVQFAMRHVRRPAVALLSRVRLSWSPMLAAAPTTERSQPPGQILTSTFQCPPSGRCYLPDHPTSPSMFLCGHGQAASQPVRADGGCKCLHPVVRPARALLLGLLLLQDCVAR